MKALLLLDIDGVLMLADDAGREQVSPVAVRLLNELLASTKASVAIISDRRNTTAPVELLQMLRDAGLQAPQLTLCTPGVDFAVAVEHSLRLEDPDVFAIIDDNAERYKTHSVVHRGAEVALESVLLQPSNRYGLLPESMPALCDMLCTPHTYVKPELVEGADEDL